jgi:putative NADH-flavin reductase
MQITVFGASGKVGSLVVEEALRRGYTVVAFVHSRNLFSPSGRLIVRKGDVYNTADVASAVQGSDAVVSCLSSWGTKGRDVLSRFVSAATAALVNQNSVRLVTLTGVGVEQNPGLVHAKLLRMMGIFPFGKVFADAEHHIWLLGQSKLNWTAVCSPVMNNLGGPNYTLSLRIGNPLATISRRAVAAALLDQIESTEYVRQTPVIHRN